MTVLTLLVGAIAGGFIVAAALALLFASRVPKDEPELLTARRDWRHRIYETGNRG
jgi:gas vesicle protein